MIEKINDNCRVKVREKILNPLFGKKRLAKLKDADFTIISNNCWGGHVYRYFSHPYDSPTVGLYFFAEDYIKFITNLRDYIQKELNFISIEQSRHRKELKEKKQENVPIGLLGDIEIVFLHYKTEEEARTKWERRRNRIHWNHLIVKMSEQNGCSLEHLRAFDNLPYENKLVFVSNDYHIESQVIFKEFWGCGDIPNDTLHFRKYVDLIKLINGEPDFRRMI